jgi:NAD(P)-dependent dehydrogenase (short-subunit alcohol dehydrogenase family)
MQTILITGAGSGVGRAAARAFLATGWRVGLAGRRLETLQEAAQGHAGALIMQMDVTDAAQVDAGFAQALAAWGRLDVLFNNAGIFVKGAPIDEISLADWQALSATNITGMFLCARAAFGIMRRQVPMGGRIINNGSVSAHVPRPGSAPYTMSKHAVTGLTRTLALDGRAFDIAAGQIDIGNALTEMVVPMQAGVPQADGSVRAEAVMDVSHAASAVVYMAGLPLDANVPFMTVMATKMPYLGRG